MPKPLIALLALPALALAGTVAFAQTPPTPEAGQRPAEARPVETRPAPLSRADLDAFTDARIAGIQAGLKLTPEQQRLFVPVERAVRAIATDRAARIEQRRERMASGQGRPQLDFLARLERRSEASGRNAENIKGLTEAMKPFWATLDERQKRLLPALMRPTRMAGGGRGDWHRGMMERRGGRSEAPQRP